MTTKYFQAPVGTFISNGKTKIKFPISVLKITNENEIEILGKCQSVKEISAEKAAELCPSLYPLVGEESNNETDDGTLTVKQMKEEMEEKGVSPEVLKKAKTKAEVVELYESFKKDGDNTQKSV